MSKQALEIIDNILAPKAAALSRTRKEKRINALGIDADEIYEEITSKYSPFKIPGQEYDDADLKKISKAS